MGKKTSETTVGHNYYMIAHAVPCVDADGLLRFDIGEKKVWDGDAMSEIITLDKPVWFQSGSVENGFKFQVAINKGAAINAAADEIYTENAVDPIPDFSHALNLVFFDEDGDGNPVGGKTGLQRRFPDLEPIFHKTSGGWNAADAAITSALDWIDKNPINVIRDSLSHLPVSFGTTWDAAADVALAQRFGISVLDDRTRKPSTLVEEICTHIDARVYVDRQTGLLEINTIRDDYDVNDLVVYDDSNVIGRAKIKRADPSRAANSLTGTFTNARKQGRPSSVKITNDARVARYGEIEGQPRNYPMFTRRGNLVRVLRRDLRAIVNCPATGEIRVVGMAPGLNKGSPFILNLPRQGENNIICRVIDFVEGGVYDNSTVIRFIEDVFSIGDEIDFGDDPVDPVTTTALPVDVRLVQETPYYAGVIGGEDEFTSGLSSDSDFGIVMVLAKKPNGLHTDYSIRSSPNSSGDIGTGEYTLATNLTSDITRMQTTFDIDLPIRDVTDELIQIGNEFMRVDTFVRNSTTATITVGRACIDVAPAPIEAGAVVFTTEYLNTDQIARTAGEAVNYRLLSNTVSDQLAFADANVDALTYDSRAIRPYPPKRFKVEGSYEDGQEIDGSVTLTWEATNRLLQATPDVYEDHDLSGTITPESGTTWIVRAKAYDGTGTLISTYLDTNVGSDLTYAFAPGSEPSGTAYVGLSVTGLRDGYESWTAPEITVYVDGLLLLRDSGEALLADDGTFLIPDNT